MSISKTPVSLLKALLWIFTVFFAVNSCTRNEIPNEDVSGILSCQFQLPDGRVFNCVVNQVDQTIENSEDSLLFGTTTAILSSVRPVFTTTVGANVMINGMKIVSGETVVDLTQSLKVETFYLNAKRDYQMKAFVEKADHSQTSGAKVNTDMRMTGLPSFNVYSAAWFNNILYALGSYYPGGTSVTGTAYYELYTSPNGALWTKVNTTPNVIGGYGTQLIVRRNKLYAVGGARLYGKDINGNNPESSIAWRIMSTADGTNWTDCTSGQVNNPTGRAFVQMCVHDDTLIVRRGKAVSFGMWQNAGYPTNIYKTVDGTNWIITTPNAAADNITPPNRTDDAMFSFNGKLWIVGGYASYIAQNGILPNAYSSSDNGKNWVREAVDSLKFNIFGHKVVTDGNKMYMLGGERLIDNVRIGVKETYYSTDAVTWSLLPNDEQLPVAYTSRYFPSVFLGENNLIWIMGGFVNSNANYAISGLNMDYLYDVWAKKLK